MFEYFNMTLKPWKDAFGFWKKKMENFPGDINPWDMGIWDELLNDKITSSANDYKNITDAYEKILEYSIDILLILTLPKDETADKTIARAHDDIDISNSWEDKSASEYDKLIEKAFREGDIIGITNCITRLRRTEDALRQSEKNYRAVVEDQTELICRYRPDGIFTFVNDAYCRYFGKSRQELMGHSLFSIVPEETRNQFMRTLKPFSPDKTTKMYEHEVILPNRGKSWLRWSSRAFFDKKGNLTEYQDVGRDITRNKRMEEELIKAKIQAENANQAKSEFVANMSHEIRTPISSIMGFAEILLSTERRKEQRENLENIKTSANILLTIINDILDFSKIEARKLDIRSEDFDFSDVMERITSTFNILSADKRLSFSINIMPDVPQYLHGDSNRLEQIINNLVSNALKFTEKGSVFVEVRKYEQTGQRITLLFLVRDTGIGIPGYKLPRLFQSFSQLDNSYSKKYHGTGLGLVISKKLAEMMGGTMWVESKDGEGSTFYFTVQFQEFRGDLKSFQGKTEPVDEIRNDTLKLKILLAEDNKFNQTIMLHLLRREECSVTVASNGKEALAALEKDNFDIILMDVQMPEMDGVEATKIIRAKEHDHAWADKKDRIPIIALTSYAMKGDKELFLDAGMDYYLTKPVDMKKLKSAVNRLVFSRGDSVSPVSDLVMKKETKVLDRETGLKIFGGDEAFLEKYYAIFAEGILIHKQKFKEALADSDLMKIQRHAHNFKSISGNIGAESCQVLAAKIEHAARNNNQDQIHILYPMLEQEMIKVRSLIED